MEQHHVSGRSATPFIPKPHGRADGPLSAYRLLVADGDRELCRVLASMLADMGFSNVRTTRSGRDALKMLGDNAADIVITEWDMPDMNGIDLIQHIRRDAAGGNPALPVMMFTGRAEQSDVLTARDNGVNEYVVKPFSAQSVYARLENMIERPREFVTCKAYVGPNRRGKGRPPEGMEDRRGPQPAAKSGKVAVNDNAAALWSADFSLKQKLGLEKLSSLITPEVIQQAQAGIDAMNEEGLGWIRENLRELGFYSIQSMIREDEAPMYLTKIRDTAALIHARAGTFKCPRASQVAYMLYVFCRNHAQPGNPAHQTIINKHIEVLQVFLGGKARNIGGPQGDAVIDELKNLVRKFVH